MGTTSSGMVADLLELTEHREHGSAAVERPLVLLDARHPAVDGRGVEARLLDREVARHLRDRDRRQLEIHLRRILRASQHERPDERPESLQRRCVAPRLDRAGERPFERLPRAEQAGVDEVHDRPELAEPVLDRRPGERERPPPRDPPQRAMTLRPRILRVLCLVEQQPVPLDPREQLHVPRRDVVRGDHDVARPKLRRRRACPRAEKARGGGGRAARVRSGRSRAPTAGRRSSG